MDAAGRVLGSGGGKGALGPSPRRKGRKGSEGRRCGASLLLSPPGAAALCCRIVFRRHLTFPAPHLRPHYALAKPLSSALPLSSDR